MELIVDMCYDWILSIYTNKTLESNELFLFNENNPFIKDTKSLDKVEEYFIKLAKSSANEKLKKYVLILDEKTSELQTEIDFD